MNFDKKEIDILAFNNRLNDYYVGYLVNCHAARMSEHNIESNENIICRYNISNVGRIDMEINVLNILNKLVNNRVEKTKVFNETEKTKIIFWETKTYEYRKLLDLVGYNDTVDEISEIAALDSKYDFIKILGAGVKGKTYLVHYKELNQFRAIKLMEAYAGGERIGLSYPEEAKIYAKMESARCENIVRVYDSGNNLVKSKILLRSGEKIIDRGYRYAIVMEYVDGKTLREISDSRLDADKVLDISSQIFNGIYTMYSNNIVHGDLNLDNIKINSDNIVKILDFGIAGHLNQKKSELSRRYGAPKGSLASDLFSLGLIIPRLYLGKHFVSPHLDKEKIDSYAERVNSLKKEILSEGKITEKYQTKIKEKLPIELQGIVKSCLESGNEIEKVKGEFLKSKEELKYYFMDKNILIDRINELENENKKLRGSI